MAHSGQGTEGEAVFDVDTTLPMSGNAGYTVRVFLHHPALPVTRSWDGWRRRRPGCGTSLAFSASKPRREYG